MDAEGMIAPIEENYRAVLEDINHMVRLSGRDPDSVRLVVVTKGHPVESIHEVITAGARQLGENYLEEALGKILFFEELQDLEWHMIGHVQSRKAAGVISNFSWIQSVDSLKLATRLSRLRSENKQALPILIECNVSGEETKFGFPTWDETHWEHLIPDLGAIMQLPGLLVSGLMTIAPYLDHSEKARPFFNRLACFRSYLREVLPQANWAELSMGMSGDYSVAIQEGATIVRIGTAIMGNRQR